MGTKQTDNSASNIRIAKVEVENFLGFRSLSLDPIPGINLIVGKNDSGKTGFLKLLYTVTKSLELYGRKQSYEQIPYKNILGNKLFDVFQPREHKKIGEIVTKSQDQKLNTNVYFTGSDNSRQDISFRFGEYTTKTINDCTHNIKAVPQAFNAIFVPAKEVLTAFRAIKFTREPHYLAGFDDTYIDLIKQLEIPVQIADSTSKELNPVYKQLEDMFQGTIEQTDNKDEPFIFKKGNRKFAISLTAEGVKKIGLLNILLKNRELRKGTILFMDEPEMNLHPQAIRQLMRIIVAIAEAGVQIFLASHSYFVVNQLYICARRNNTDALCHSFELNEHGFIDCTSSSLQKGMPSTSIIEEALKMFDEDVQTDL